MSAIKEAKEILERSMSVPVKREIAQMVGAKLKKSFQRVKEVWGDKNRDIRKIEKKLEKLNEQLFELKEERENLENELEGIRETYKVFCEQTMMPYDLE